MGEWFGCMSTDFVLTVLLLLVAKVDRSICRLLCSSSRSKAQNGGSQTREASTRLPAGTSCLEIVYTFTKEPVNLQCLNLVCELGNIQIECALYTWFEVVLFVSCYSDVWILSSQEN